MRGGIKEIACPAFKLRLQLGANQQPHPANIAENIELLINLVQMLDKRLTPGLNASQHVRRVDDIKRCPRYRAGQRVTAVSGAVRTHVERGGNLLSGQHRAYREAATERLRAGEDIRRHAVVHIGKQIAGTPHPALHFIKYQQRLVLVTKFTQTLQEFRRSRSDAALSLNRLNDHRAGVIVHHRFDRMQIVKRDMDDIRRFWPKAVGVFRLPTNGHGKQRTAVKRIMEGNDFGFERAMTHAGIVARQLKGGFVGFSTGVHEQHALGKGRINDFTA